MSHTRICIVRHGETAWNAEKRIQGHVDIPLAEQGLLQAEAAARWLTRTPVDALYSSDLLRAWQTAERIGAALGLPPSPLTELRERRYGIFEGVTYEDAKTEHPVAYQILERRDADQEIPGGGESLRQVAARVTACLRRIAAQHLGQTVVVVTHGGVLDIVNRFVRGNPLETPRDFLIPNTGLTWLTVTGDDWVLDAWGETSHLTDGALDEIDLPA